MTADGLLRPVRCVRLSFIGGAVVLMALGGSRVQGQISPGPLARAHRELEGASNCAQCHGLKREPMSQMCVGCHKDVGALMQQNRGYHGRDVKMGKKACAQCHPDHAGAAFQMIEWPEGATTKFDHRKAGWALKGAHAEAKCESCHTSQYRNAPVAALSRRKVTAGWVGLETTCNSCHKADDVHKGELKANCETCHDSNDWAPAPGFDHEKSDYPLTGKHSDITCDKCHQTPKLPVRLNADGKRVGRFKPVPFKECSSCHTDPHKGALGAKCGDCHVTRGFDVIDKAAFNHQVTRYPLRGKHLSASCESCHGPNLANKTPAFGTCASCHKDAHGGEATLGGRPADCAACHAVSGFAPSTFTVAQHRGATYPLEGKHTTVTCALCHTPGAALTRQSGRATSVRVGRLRVESSSCASCHQDAHGGELASRADKGACESCHSTAGFAPSSFSATAHGKLRVALDGRHGKVVCAACHGPSRPGLAPIPGSGNRKATLTIAIRETECASCHTDPHAGRYLAKGALPITGSCSACHGAVQWRPATMTSGVHGQFSYALEGAHRAVPCVECHDELKTRQATSTLLLSAKGVASLPFTTRRPTTCTTCHQKSSPHGDQFIGRKDKGSCEGCHVAAAFAPASAFDHDRDASFSLTGAHATVPCASCHRSATTAGPIQYRPLSGKCESCHAAVRKGEHL